MDTSILAGFAFGANKAEVCKTEGVLLGHHVSRRGAAADGTKTQAIQSFAPLKETQHVRQFLGCTNWVRWYLSTAYSAAVKQLSDYLKPGAVFPEAGLGAGTTTGDNAVKAIKLMCCHIATRCYKKRCTVAPRSHALGKPGGPTFRR